MCLRKDCKDQLPFTAAGNKPAHPQALTFNDSPADAAEHEEQVLLQHHNVFFVFVFFFPRCFLSAKSAGVRGASSSLQMTGLSGWVRTFLRQGARGLHGFAVMRPEQSGAEAAL